MGTNYYVATNHCECCTRSDTLHIGKSSWGWSFSFRGYRGEYSDAEHELTSWPQWKEYLIDKMIIDEYSEPISYADFVAYVEGPKSPHYVNENGKKNLSHNEAGKKDKYPWFNPEHDWDDEFGYSFSDREFS